MVEIRFMKERPLTNPLAYLNGEYVPLAEAKLSIFDVGLVHGFAVTEMLRTFHHHPFESELHLERLTHSLTTVGLIKKVDVSAIPEILNHLLEYNTQQIPKTHELGIIIFVTGGWNQTYLGTSTSQQIPTSTLCVHTFPLPFELWSELYRQGQHLVVSEVRGLSPATIPPTVKYRSRLHWILADQQVQQLDSSARALLLDEQGHVTETATGNLFLVKNERLKTPKSHQVLHGISRTITIRLAGELGIRVEESLLTLQDLITADELFTTSTPTCLLPVGKLNGNPIGNRIPGPLTADLLRAWNEYVGLDIIQQMQQAE